MSSSHQGSRLDYAGARSEYARGRGRSDSFQSSIRPKYDYDSDCENF